MIATRQRSLKTVGQTSALREWVARQRPGWSLEQPFYTSEEIYDLERRGWLAGQWYLLAHRSEVAESGSFIVREVLGESLIIARDSEGTLRGFYNVCRHRGSRICDADGHAAKGFTCPYHAWSYRLDGTFRAAAALPQGIDTRQLGLQAVPVREMGGMVFASLKGDLRHLEAVQPVLEPGLRYHGIPEARIAARRSYPIHANWKLVMENFLECYHCFPAHPEFCSVMRQAEVIGRVPADGGEAWQREVQTWFKEEADPDSPLSIRPDFPDAYSAGRFPIGKGRKTQSRDGEPVAPLMGRLQRFDGGVSGFRLEPFIYVMASNDHAVMFQILPTGAERTDVILSWLVNASVSAAEVDVERMIWLWDVTTTQDKVIIERNAAGVRSRAYAPGPYSTLESATARLVGRYLQGISAGDSISGHAEQ